MCSTLSWVGSLVDSDCALWLCLIEVGEAGGVVKISLSNLFNYFSVSGDSKQKKIHKKVVLWPQLGRGGVRPLCGGHNPKVTIFFLRNLLPQLSVCLVQIIIDNDLLKISWVINLKNFYLPHPYIDFINYPQVNLILRKF